MNLFKYGMLASVLAIIVIGALTCTGSPDRLPSEEKQVREEVGLRLDQVETAERAASEEAVAEPEEPAKAAEAIEEPSTEVETPEKEDEMENWPESAPDVFKVKFECTHGDFIVECYKEWAPLGTERFYQLVREGFYDDSGFFRVVPGFVIQFGLAGDPAVTAQWRNKRIQDDPVTQSNLPGTLTFATSGANTRTTQLFINTGSNARLDGMGFSPFGKVIEGMDVVKNVNAEYGERPNQGLITAEGNKYLKQNFPNMTFIKKASLVE